MNQFKKTINIILVITLLMSYLVTPTYFVFANTCTGYRVSVLKSDGTTTDLSCHTSYSDAKTAMLNHHSNENSVAVIYNNSGNIINAKYAIAKFVPNKTENLYPTSALKTATTYTATSYGSDVAFIDYDPTYNSAKIKISGYTGWVSLEYLTIVPINQLITAQIRINATSIRVRPTPSTALPEIGNVFEGERYQYYEKKVAEGYTWYKIKYKSQDGWIASTNNWTSEIVDTGLQTYYEVNANGELVHYFEQNFSGKISTASNVLGPAPNYLTKLTKYYSFDGNYFYTDIKSMINDYRNNTFASAINSNIPHYNYYQYLPHRTKSSITSDDIASYLSSYTAKPIKEEYINPLGYVDNKLVRYDCDGKTVLAYLEKDNGETPDKDIIKFCKDLEGNLSVLYGEGPNFINSGNAYGINSSSALALAIHESWWGRSLIAVAKNNVFGHSAYDSSPVGSAAGYPSVKYGIDYHTRDYVSKGYANPTDYRYYGSHFGNKGSGMNVKYASDPYWGEKVAKHYYNLDKSVGLQDHNMYEIGLKRTSAVVNIRKEPTTASTSLYTLDANDTNIPMVILGEVTGEKIGNSTKWYKIQTDPVLNSTRDATLPKAEIGEYNWDTNYAYIHSSLVHISEEEEYYEKKEGMFHFEKLEWNNTTQTIDFRGYLAVKGVNNTLSIPASYNLILQDVNTNEEHIIVLDRWTNTKEHPFIVPSEDGYNYSGSWFKSNIDLSNVPEGDYTVYVRARTNRVEAKIKLRNFFSKTMTRKITDNNGRGYLFRTNYYIKEVPLELFIRDNGLIEPKETPTVDNMFNSYTDIGFEGKYLKIKGTSFNVNGDYSTSQNIERKIVFENTKTFERHEFTSNYIDNGDYKVTLRLPDGKDKTRAWFDSKIDLSLLNEGRYAIIIKTTAGNISDYGELHDIFSRALNQKVILGDRVARLELNTNRRMRVELVIEQSDIVNEVTDLTWNDNGINIEGWAYSKYGQPNTLESISHSLVLKEVTNLTELKLPLNSLKTSDINLTNCELHNQFVGYNQQIDLRTIPNGSYLLNIETVVGSNASYSEELVTNINEKNRIVRSKTSSNEKLLTFRYENNKIYLDVEDFNYEYDIVIDVGHYTAGDGTQNSTITERELNLIVSNYEKERYEAHGLAVWLNRTTNSLPEMRLDNDWSILHRAADTIGYKGVTSKVVYSNHHNGNVSTVAGFEMIMPAAVPIDQLGTELAIYSSWKTLDPTNLKPSLLRSGFYTRSLTEPYPFNTKINGEIYTYRNYYAMIRIPYEIYNVKAVTFEPIYMTNSTEFAWYYNNNNWKKMSELKIKHYVESLGKTYDNEINNL